MMNEHYVILFRRWKPRAKQWETVLAASDDRPMPHETLIAAFVVEGATTRDSARGVVVEWLYRNRPASMRVRELVLAK